MASDGLRQGQLVQLLRDYEGAIDSGIYLVYLPNSTLPSPVRTFIDFLVARFSPVPPWEETIHRGRKNAE